ncbi:hypothetical protein [Halostella salina]|uniref:hypothetical protein n=1 Tax=Halostella salina TaxID=1547897 RepID=UPI0013CF386D|nr:hypothetical protein [Halostella salina]
MAVHGSTEAEETMSDTEEETLVTACETRPGRTVFTEADNSDAWIATDLTVDLER